MSFPLYFPGVLYFKYETKDEITEAKTQTDLFCLSPSHNSVMRSNHSLLSLNKAVYTILGCEIKAPTLPFNLINYSTSFQYLADVNKAMMRLFKQAELYSDPLKSPEKKNRLLFIMRSDINLPINSGPDLTELLPAFAEEVREKAQLKKYSSLFERYEEIEFHFQGLSSHKEKDLLNIRNQIKQFNESQEKLNGSSNFGPQIIFKVAFVGETTTENYDKKVDLNMQYNITEQPEQKMGPKLTGLLSKDALAVVVPDISDILKKKSYKQHKLIRSEFISAESLLSKEYAPSFGKVLYADDKLLPASIIPKKHSDIERNLFELFKQPEHSERLEQIVKQIAEGMLQTYHSEVKKSLKTLMRNVVQDIVVQDINEEGSGNFSEAELELEVHKYLTGMFPEAFNTLWKKEHLIETKNIKENQSAQPLYIHRAGSSLTYFQVLTQKDENIRGDNESGMESSSLFDTNEYLKERTTIEEEQFIALNQKQDNEIPDSSRTVAEEKFDGFNMESYNVNNPHWLKNVTENTLTFESNNDSREAQYRFFGSLNTDSHERQEGLDNQNTIKSTKGF